MWPQNNRLLNKQQIADLTRRFSPEFTAFIHDEKLDESFSSSFQSVYLHLAKWIEHKHQNTPIIIGINGAQGSGKTTLCKLLSKLLSALFDKSVLHLSIDDLYLSHQQRQDNGKNLHPLLSVRGVPGTHNVQYGIALLNGIKQGNQKIRLPVFDKAIDDVLPEAQWRHLDKPIDIVLFEGWCVGASAQQNAELIEPLNGLEKSRDKDGRWRHFVNQQLAEPYRALFSHIDYLIMLKVPSMDAVYEWRCLQEDKLNPRALNTHKVMSKKDIKQFVMYFERLTRHCLKTMPHQADVLIDINPAHQIKRVGVR